MTNFADRTIWTGYKSGILRGLDSASVDLIYVYPPFKSTRTCAAPVSGAGSRHGLNARLVLFYRLTMR